MPLPYATVRSPLSKDELTTLRERLLSSPLLGRSTLTGTFQASRGFAFVFTRAGLPRLVERHPELQPYLRFALGSPRVLQTWTERAWRRPPPSEPNAFFLNVLVVPTGAQIGRHVDATLRGPSGVEHAVPSRVSVLYLQVPHGIRGGELRLYAGETPVGAVEPREGRGVFFDGRLGHEVAPFAADADALRVSLVCEQYALAPEAVARLPELLVQSKAGFGAYLEAAAARSPDHGR